MEKKAIKFRTQYGPEGYEYYLDGKRASSTKFMHKAITRQKSSEVLPIFFNPKRSTKYFIHDGKVWKSNVIERLRKMPEIAMDRRSAYRSVRGVATPIMKTKTLKMLLGGTVVGAGAVGGTLLAKKIIGNGHEKVAGKLKQYIQRRREEKKMYDGGRPPRSQRPVRTTAGALFQLAKLR